MTSQLDRSGHTKETPDNPRGLIILFSGSTVPTGWQICDGTNGTPDLRDRVLVGDSAVGAGSSGGTTSATTAYSHSGSAVAAHPDHAVTQPIAHDNHAATQPDTHTDHTVTQAADHGTHTANTTHTHNSHTTTAATAGATTVIQDNFTHAANSTHTHAAHSAHTGAAVDAHPPHTGWGVDAHSAHSGFGATGGHTHSVTQADAHAVFKHVLLVFIMWMGTS